jgi:hypothetical protein
MRQKVKRSFLVVSCLAAGLLAGCASTRGRWPAEPVTPSAGVQREAAKFLYAFKGKNVLFLHLKPDPGAGQKTVQEGERIGEIEDLPPQLSRTNDALLRQVQGYHADRRYLDAYRLLLSVADEEKDNLFFLELLGKTAFWMQGEEYHEISYRTYARLIRLIEDGHDTSVAVVIDLWFIDAYLKMGILCLDFREYERAALELSKVLNHATNIEPQTLDLLYSYLAESYYFLQNAELNRYFCGIAKAHNPRNTYVDEFRL